MPTSSQPWLGLQLPSRQAAPNEHAAPADSAVHSVCDSAGAQARQPAGLCWPFTQQAASIRQVSAPTACVQAPPSHASSVQTRPSLSQVTPSAKAMWLHPVLAHVSVVHELPSSQDLGAPLTQDPLWQASPSVQVLPSLQVVPSASGAISHLQPSALRAAVAHWLDWQGPQSTSWTAASASRLTPSAGTWSSSAAGVVSPAGTACDSAVAVPHPGINNVRPSRVHTVPARQLPTFLITASQPGLRPRPCHTSKRRISRQFSATAPTQSGLSHSRRHPQRHQVPVRNARSVKLRQHRLHLSGRGRLRCEQLQPE